MATLPPHQLEGRLFADQGQLCMILEVDHTSTMVRVSRQKEIVEMPLADVTSRLARYTHLSLDGLNSQKTDKRLSERDDGWYFSSREYGMQGPFPTREAANDALNTYVIAAQDGRTPGQR